MAGDADFWSASPHKCWSINWAVNQYSALCRNEVQRTRAKPPRSLLAAASVCVPNSPLSKAVSRLLNLLDRFIWSLPHKLSFEFAHDSIFVNRLELQYQTQQPILLEDLQSSLFRAHRSNCTLQHYPESQPILVLF